MKVAAIKGEPSPRGEYLRFDRKLGGDHSNLSQRGNQIVIAIKFPDIKAATEAMFLLNVNLRMHRQIIIKFPLTGASRRLGKGVRDSESI
jgi:hypothetical protein